MLFAHHIGIPGALSLVVNPEMLGRQHRLGSNVILHESKNISDKDAGWIKRTASTRPFQCVLEHGNQWSIARQENPRRTTSLIFQTQCVNELKSGQCLPGPGNTGHEHDMMLRERARLL